MTPRRSQTTPPRPAAPLKCRLLAIAIVLLLPLGGLIRPHATTALAAEINQQVLTRLAAPLVESGTVVGLSAAVVQGDRVWRVNLGTTVRGSDQPPTSKTIYEIGSITKVFTCLVLAEEVVRAHLRLDQPVAELLPDRKIPTWPERPIRLEDLATHSSGLPRLPTNFAPADARNPYADYTEQDLFAFLADYELRRAPGKRYAYSNLAMGLLGVALAAHSGKAYEQLIVETICQPLDMPDTRITLSAEQQRRLAAGHDADGQTYPNWDIPALAGAGALRSTVDDLVRFATAELGLRESPLAEAIRLSQQPRFDIGRNRGQVALGWHLSPDGSRLTHSGQTGGYHSYLGLERGQPHAVVILANTATGAVDRLARQYHDLLAGREVKPLELPRPIRLPSEVLDRYVGKYRLTPLATFDVRRSGDELSVQLTGQDRFRVYPTSETEFFYRVVDARITFVVDDQGRATRLILHQNGRDMPAPRIEESP